LLSMPPAPCQGSGDVLSNSVFNFNPGFLGGACVGAARTAPAPCVLRRIQTQKGTKTMSREVWQSSTLATCPMSAEGTRFGLLCCQPGPVPWFSPARLFTVACEEPCRPTADSGVAIYMLGLLTNPLHG